MAVEEYRHLLWVGLTRLGQRFGCEQPLVKPLWGVVRKYGKVDHRGAPLLAVRHLEEQPQTADRVRLVGLIRQAAAQRKPADQRNVAGLEDGQVDGDRSRQGVRLILRRG